MSGRYRADDGPTSERPLRIAWLGPEPGDVGGVRAMAGQVVLGLAELGAAIELFLEGPAPDGPGLFADLPDVTAHFVDSGWRFDRWYSSNNFTKLVTGTGARVLAQRRLVDSVVSRHEQQPFDVLYRFSQIELFRLRSVQRRLPPIVVHPEVHAEAERFHHWRERHLSRGSERPAQFLATHAYLDYRSRVQRRDVQLAELVIAPSRRFATYMHDDYGVSRDRLRVLPNTIDLDRFSPSPDPPDPRPVRLLFVSRMSVRKGVELVVHLSHRLDDLAGAVQIDCIGGVSLFSDYSTVLNHLNPRTARHVGHVSAHDAPGLYRNAHCVLQPSWYEPFALTVAEGLACGLPAIVSDEVGAGEDIDDRVCRVHAAGDLDALERDVRQVVQELQEGRGRLLAAVAREEAVARFGRATFARGFEMIGRELTAPRCGHAPDDAS